MREERERMELQLCEERQAEIKRAKDLEIDLFWREHLARNRVEDQGT